MVVSTKGKLDRQARLLPVVGVPYGINNDWMSFGNVTHARAVELLVNRLRYGLAERQVALDEKVLIETRDADSPESIFTHEAWVEERPVVISHRGD